MRIIGKQLLYGLCALALFGTTGAGAAESCATASLATVDFCLDPIKDETLLAIAATGIEREGAPLNGAQTETAIILWDELQKPTLSASGSAGAMVITKTGIRLNLGDFAGDL